MFSLKNYISRTGYELMLTSFEPVPKDLYIYTYMCVYSYS